MAADASSPLQLFINCGLDEKTAKNAIANARFSSNLVDVIREAGVESGCDKNVGNLLYTASTKYPANALKHRPVFLSYVASRKIKSMPQLEAGLAYMASVGSEPLNERQLAESSGVGVEVTVEDIRAAVSEVIAKEKDRLLTERYRANVGTLLGLVRAIQPWADGKLARVELDAQLRSLLGERTAEDDEKPKKKEKKKPAKAVEPAASSSAPASEEVGGAESSDLYPLTQFPNPEDNIQVHTEIRFSSGQVWRPRNIREKLQEHLNATAGKLMSRFPPEPNGYLHIGHAKAMNVSFGLARERGGHCYLRYDDTNPEAEKQEYIDHIQEIVGWLGWQPYKVTFSSDYFQTLYELAVELIKKGYAYVDHQTADEIKEHREKRVNSPWRDRPIEESLALFEDMRRGLVEEGAATLRMKQDMQNDNPNMYDLIAYRIKFTAHPHAGDKWCIYPSYDYTHCIVDSLENVTHSLCTLEFETRRASYYWLLEALGLYHPFVWEYARLNITHTVLSKRKLNRLVTDKYVDGWDDPRLMTLSGLRRRGASPEAINAFCRAVGITRNDNTIKLALLEHFIRADMDQTAPRALVVLNPLKVVIDNIPEGIVQLLDARLWPESKNVVGVSETSYKVPFSRVVYIDSADFRLQDSKDYYGLAPGKTVMLRYAYPVKFREVVLAEDGSVKEVHVEYDPAKTKIPKGVIHWVGEGGPGIRSLEIEVRLFDKLFLSENPAELGDEWLKDLNPGSLKVVKGALAVPVLASAKPGDKFQFERLGFFCVDTSSTPEHIVVNRTVTLRDSYAKSR